MGAHYEGYQEGRCAATVCLWGPGGPAAGGPGVGGGARCAAERGEPADLLLCKHPGAGDRSPLGLLSPVRRAVLVPAVSDCFSGLVKPVPGLQAGLGRRRRAGATRLRRTRGLGLLEIPRRPKRMLHKSRLICCPPLIGLPMLLPSRSAAAAPVRSKEGGGPTGPRTPGALLSPNLFHGFPIRSPSYESEGLNKNPLRFLTISTSSMPRGAGNPTLPYSCRAGSSCSTCAAKLTTELSISRTRAVLDDDPD